MVPALYIGIENDESCTLVVKGAWPEAVTLQNVNEVTEEVLSALLMKVADLDTGLLVAGPPCQPFSNLNDDKKGFEDPATPVS